MTFLWLSAFRFVPVHALPSPKSLTMYNKLGRVRLFLSRHVGGGALVPAVVIFHHRTNHQAASLLQMEPETFHNWKGFYPQLIDWKVTNEGPGAQLTFEVSFNNSTENFIRPFVHRKSVELSVRGDGMLHCYQVLVQPVMNFLRQSNRKTFPRL